MTLITELFAARQAVAAVSVSYLIPAAEIGSTVGTSVFIWDEPSADVADAVGLFVAIVDADGNVVPQGGQDYVGLAPLSTEGNAPIAAGAALAQKMQGKDNVVVSFFGDGATNEGAFHEALNLAAVWDLPVVFVCENNKYGMSFSTAKSMKVEKISERAAAYGFPGVTVDGNDVDAVFEAAREAVERARSGGGPTLIECLTYRHKGHSKSDKNLYRTKEEIEFWKTKDPVGIFETKLVESGRLSQDEAAELTQKVRDSVRAAIQEATQAPDSDPAELLSSVYRQVS